MSAADAAEPSAPASRGAPSSGVSPISYHGQLAPQVHQRLAKALGPKRAAEAMAHGFARLGGRPIDTPQDMLDFAEALVKSVGLVQAVGRSLKVQALLRGAIER